MPDKRIEAVIDGPFRHGVISNMPKREYFAACGINPSSLKQPSPKHVKWTYENNGEATDAMRLGTAVHTLCWDPHRFGEDIAVYDGRRQGKAWEDFQDEHEGKTIIKEEQFERATAIATALTSDPQVKRLASHGIAETAVFTELNGMQHRGLIDWINTDLSILCDLKVVNGIEDRMFGFAVVRYGWDVSMACYRNWFQHEANKEIKAVKFIAVESKPPFDVAVIPVDAAVLESGWSKADKASQAVRRSIESGVWPGIAGGEEYPLLYPEYAMAEEEVQYT